jgi:hypothetical protein
VALNNLTTMRRTVLLTFVAVAAALAELSGSFSASPDDPAIQYDTRPPNDPVAVLNRRIQAGEVQLRFEGPSGYLRSVLGALQIPIESQLVVFSKTSLQAPIITPKNPRSLFFNDSVAAGWVKGEPFVELAAEDPQQGLIFYTLDQVETAKPVFQRQDQCLQCHESYSSLGVPGTLLRSSFVAPDGQPLRQLGDYLNDHRTPLEQRWGGWYVTGKRVPAGHLGNTLVTYPGTTPPANAPSLVSLQEKFDTGPYLSPYSDVGALMVFDHQMRMMNLLTRIGWDTRLALYHRRDVSKILHDDAADFVDYLLFIDEAPLPGNIEGNSGFAKKFSALGPRDHKGRSLRDLDLEHRLLRYPCSYMIYSPAFDALPPQAKDAIYRRTWEILSGQEKTAKYARVSREDRRAIIEILRDTKPDLPTYFR